MTRATKTEKIIIEDYGVFLGANTTNFIVRKKKEELLKIPFYRVSEIIIPFNNIVSTKALFWASIYNIDVLLTAPSGRPLATLMPLNFSNNIKTRIAQYESTKTQKGLEIAKEIVQGKIKAQSQILEKYKLSPFNRGEILKTVKKLKGKDIDSIKQKLNIIEGKYTKLYFSQIFKLFPKHLRAEARHTFRAYEPLNNLLNLAYEVLAWKVFRAVIRARLEPYLGFLHSIQTDKPSLVCDLQELYRPFVDDFLIHYSKNLNKKDFKVEYGKDKAPRMFLKYPHSSELIKNLNGFFQSKVSIPRIKAYRKTQTFESLINEEVTLLAMYLRGEKPEWKPRTPIFN
ncbi:MAG: CRISPR-associated endonuclease Cas1 [Nitrososphaerales archaeon]